MKTVAIFPAAGIGDALLMMIAAHGYSQAGYQVSVYHNHLPTLQEWFPGVRIASRTEWNPALCPEQLLIVENDNSAQIQEFIRLYRSRLSLFYPSYKVGKHAPLHPGDQCFDTGLPMADNVSAATTRLLGLYSTKRNGITPPASLTHRVHSTRVLIHPTSSGTQKNWGATRFLKLAKKLKAQGLSPVFVVSPQEKPCWEWIHTRGFPLVATATLSSLASLIYESGYVIGNDSLAGHLASNLQIPHLIIADDPVRLQLWRPGWMPGHLVFPPSYLPKWIRKNHWQAFIPVRKVLSHFPIPQKPLA